MVFSKKQQKKKKTGAVQGVKKVKIWLLVLLSLLSFSAGLKAGPFVPKLWRALIGLWKSAFAAGAKGGKELWEIFSPKDASSWGALIFGSLLGILLLVLAAKYDPKKKKKDFASLFPSSPQDFCKVLWVYSFALGLAIGHSLDRLPGYGVLKTFFSLAVAFLTVDTAIKIILILRDVYVKRNSVDYVYFEQKKKKVLLVTTVVGIALLGLPLWIPDFWGFTLPSLLEGSNLLDYYMALLSLTFISISVMSVLSDRSIVIYWENIAEGKLIKPVFGSFAAYTYYSIGAAIAAGVCVALGNGTAFLIFATINIAAMVMLTHTMVDVYYDRESKKAARATELREDARDYMWVQASQWLKEEDLDTLSPESDEEESPEQRMKNKKIGAERYEEKMALLCQNVYRAKKEHDVMYLKEIYELYENNLCYFANPEGRQVVRAIFGECTKENLFPLIRTLKAHLQIIWDHSVLENSSFTFPKEHPNYWKMEPRWDQDAVLWDTLSKSDLFREWFRDIKEDSASVGAFYDFLLLLVKRAVLLYNFEVADLNERIAYATGYSVVDSYDYLAVEENRFSLKIKTEDGKTPNRDQLESFMKDILEHPNTANFAQKLMRVLFEILKLSETEDQEVLKQFWSEFPLPQAFSVHMEKFGYTEEEITLWNMVFPS